MTKCIFWRIIYARYKKGQDLMLFGDNNFDFMYSNFPLSRGVLESYVKHAIDHKKSIKDYKNSYNHASGLVDCIISCIASKDFSFNKNDRRTFKILYLMLRDYAHDNGVYSDEARTAMRVLCEYCGFAPDAIILTDHKPLGRMERLKKRFSKWFGFDDEHDDQEDKIDQMFAEIERQKSREKHDALVAEAEKRRAELQREREEREKARSVKVIHIQEEKQEEEKQQEEKQQQQEITPQVEVQAEPEKKEQEPSVSVQLVQEEISQQTEKKQIKNLAQLHRERKRKEQKRSVKVIHIQEKQNQQKKEPKNHKKTKTVRVVKIEQKTPEKRKFGRFAAISATITGFVALGAAMLFGSHNSADMTSSTVDNNNEPTFKNIYVDQSSHYDNVSTYNMIDSLKKQKSNLDSLMQYRAPSVVKSEQVAQEKQTVQTSEDKDYADAVTDASRSALNILIGAERAQKLYHDICVKVKAGIFNLPDGMSVERVAHAMEMSRIYEGHSVILDALNSDVKLTVEQQKAFNDHIASIGDLGVKLQKRMAKQHNLNQHSRYDKAGKDFQRAHAKNLKQLRQIKNRMR